MKGIHKMYKATTTNKPFLRPRQRSLAVKNELWVQWIPSFDKEWGTQILALIIDKRYIIDNFEIAYLTKNSLVYPSV